MLMPILVWEMSFSIRPASIFIRQQPLDSDLSTCNDAIDGDQLAAIADQLPITISQA